MIEVSNYIIKAYEYGYVVYRKDKVYIDKTGKESPTNPKYGGSIEDCLKIIMREQIHDYVLDSTETLALKDILHEIKIIEKWLEKAMQNA